MDYIALVKDNNVQSDHHTNSNYGSTDIFKTATTNIVVPQCSPTDSISTLQPRAIDQYDCFYTYVKPDSTTDTSTYILVSFAKLNVPTTLTHSILQRLQKFPLDQLMDNEGLQRAYGEVEKLLKENFQQYKKGMVREQTNDDIDEVVRLMNDNIDQFLQRQENINVLVDETRLLNDSGIKFHKNAVKVNKKFWWDKYKSVCLLTALIIFIIFTIFMTTYW